MHSTWLTILLDLLFVAAGTVAAAYLWTHARSIQFAGAVRAVQVLSVGIVLWAAYYLADALLHIAGPLVLPPDVLVAWVDFAGHRIRPLSDAVAVGLMLAGFVMLIRRLGRLLSRMHRSASRMQVELSSRDTLEAELKTEAEMQRALRQSKSEFLMGLSHELQTPLNGILGLASLLANTELDAEQRRLLTTLEQSAQSTLNRVSDVLDLSQLENGKVELRSTAFEPCELIRSVTGLFAPLAAERGLELGPACGDEGKQPMIGDPARIKQILTHLVSNAIKFTPEGRITVDVKAEPVDPDHMRLIFTVTDTGVGMTPEELEIATETRTLRTGSGRGVGLSICRRLVELMEGELVFDSTPGKGTRASACIIVQIEPDTVEV